MTKTRNEKVLDAKQTSAYRYCAFLRGVNVKGTSMKMAEACSVFEKAGMNAVSSVLASGNILFSAPHNRTSELKSILEKSMSEHFGYQAHLFVKSQNEIETIFNNSPFAPAPEFHIYGFVGLDGVEKILMEEFEKGKKVPGEEALIIENNFYWKVPKGQTLGSEFGNILGKKALKELFTSRNINTFEKVLGKL